jgi:glutamyl-tRNA synthetase
VAPEAFTHEGLEGVFRAAAEAHGWKAGDFFMAVRVALTGRAATPPLFELMVALGPDRVAARLARAASVLETATPA